MAQDKDTPRPRGLPSIAEARAQRANRPPAAPGSFWVLSLIAIAAMTAFYWKKTDDDNKAHCARILAKQRTVAAEHGKAFAALRDRVEKWAIDTSRGGFEPDVVAASFKASIPKGGDPPLFQRPGVYLRLTREDARSPEKIRAAAKESLRDAFTSCLLRTPHLTAHQGQACKISKECPAEHLCNEANVCAKPAQPFNLRTAYRGMRVLTDEWIRGVQLACGDGGEALVLRRYDMDIDDSTGNDLPVVGGLLRSAEYALIVIDEIPEGFKAPPDTPLAQAVQSEVHPTRVALFDLKSGEMLLRLHRTADVTIPAVPGDAATVEAQRRQILNCALAQEVRTAYSGE